MLNSQQHPSSERHQLSIFENEQAKTNKSQDLVSKSNDVKCHLLALVDNCCVFPLQLPKVVP